MNLSQDDITCLMILSRGEALLAIGKWEPTLLSLYERGLVGQRTTPGGGVDFVIGRGGELALRDYEDEEMLELIEANNNLVEIRQRHNSMQDAVRQIAQVMAAAALASSDITGDDPSAAARKWFDVALAETLKIIEQKHGG